MKITKSLIEKVENSFFTLTENNGKYSIYNFAVEFELENDPQKNEILNIISKILNLVNNSTIEKQKDILYNLDTENVIKLVTE